MRVWREGVDPALGCDGREGVYLYTEPAYGGRCLKLIADEPDLRLYGFDDRVVSVRTVGDWEATLFRDLAYTGVSALLADDTPDLAFTPLGDRQATSIQVRRLPDPPRDVCDGGPGVYLYQDPGYRGRCLKLIADAPDLRNYGFDDRASSVRTVGGYDATLFRDLSFTGAATPIAGDNLSLADDTVGDDQVTSLIVRRSEIPAGQLCAGEGVYLYQDPEFQGRCRKFITNVPDLRIYGFDNLASSVRIVGPFSAQLHADLAFRGPWTGFRGDDPNLADDTVSDNRTTSLQVQRR